MLIVSILNVEYFSMVLKTYLGEYLRLFECN
jgi:hypothetical protein